MPGEDLTIRTATAADAPAVATLVGELLQEITAATGVQAFQFDRPETVARLAAWIPQDRYFVFIAVDANPAAVGFLSLCESRALYAAGDYGTIPELYVYPAFRSQGLGQRLLQQARAFATSRGWKRLEVTTPPLPFFDRTLAFYEREGFSITGGRKLKLSL